MSDQAPNPYSAPQSEILGTNPQAGSLAPPWMRLVAALIDGIILGILMLPVNFLVIRMLFKIDQNAFNQAAMAGDVAAVMAASTPPFWLTLIGNLIGVAILVAVNWKFLPKGQTIGKKVLNIQIQDRSGGLIPVPVLITRRILPLYIAASFSLWFIGPLLVLIDALLIFRPGHNTLHDDLANSKVVRL